MREAWGKTDQETASYHPLAHHCMDVAAVLARMMVLPVLCNRLDTAAGRPLSDVDCQRLAALTFLHDIGKLHPGFQAKGWPEGLWRGPTRGHLQEGWAFLQLAFPNSEHPFHQTLQQIQAWGGACEPIIAAAFAHHGRTVFPSGDPTLRDWDRPELLHYDWRIEAKRMDDALHRWFPDAFQANHGSLPEEPRFHHLIAGLMSLADWIGSDMRFFPYTAPFDPDYNARSHKAARHALEAVGLDAVAVTGQAPPSFGALTGGWQPNAAQAAIGGVSPEAKLVILESETGSGKTEAALWRFAQLFAAGKVSGLYFAVPTRAAAKQLHRRVSHAMRLWLGDSAPEVVLAIPGMLRSGDFEGQRLAHWRVRWEDKDSERTAAHRWAAEHATRYLAAWVAVGTVDQAMLGGLQVKHAHLRGSALSRSLLVVDEVHASDAYMTEVLKQLTDSHLKAGGYAMLMSATLGVRSRKEWTNEGLPDFPAASAAPYPAVWVRGESTPRTSAPAGRPRMIRVNSSPTMEPVHAAKQAMTAARHRARVLVVRNTVDRAVETWQAVREAGAQSLLMQVEGSPALHHSRFAVEDRKLLDAAVEEALGKNRPRQQRGCIVIGTQTLEQSLDIDADLLITDLCPMDVLLQRVGRLHRHYSPRPTGFETARVTVLMPDGGLDRLAAPLFFNGLGAWEAEDGFTGIYRDLAGLELTRRLVEGKTIWRIPEMNRALVEGTTHPEPLQALIQEKGKAWERYHQQFGGTEAAARMLAEVNLLDRKEPLEELKFPPSDEDIMTRLGEEGRIVALEPAPIGPFGQAVTRIALPSHWSKCTADKDEVRIEPDGNGLDLWVGDAHFRYSRAGLRRL